MECKLEATGLCVLQPAKQRKLRAHAPARLRKLSHSRPRAGEISTLGVLLPSASVLCDCEIAHGKLAQTCDGTSRERGYMNC
ncbi:MAG TPA: hypothetical protein VE821_07085 [Pyrinomonadaceae bacterium]|nr:hypothetical protein [Pyrinomonadaceae bacterium]